VVNVSVSGSVDRRFKSQQCHFSDAARSWKLFFSTDINCIELNLFANKKCNNTIKINYCYKELDNKVSLNTLNVAL